MEKKNYIVAIDLGSNNVAVVVANKLPGGKIGILGRSIKEMHGVVRGEIKNIEEVAQSIKQAVEEVEQNLGIKITEAFTGISGQHLRCARHPYYVYVAGRDGEISDEDVRKLNESMQNVQAPDGYKILHIIPQHYIVNGEEEVANPVGMFGKTLESTFNLIIGENNIVSRLEKALNKVGIRQNDMFINPLVSAEAVTLPDEKEMGVVVVDMGAGTTDVCIYHDKIVRYIGVIPMGADAVNKDIRAYGIQERYVEELKVKCGSAIASESDAEKLIKFPGRTPREPKSIPLHNLNMIIESRMKDIAEYVVQEIKAAGFEGRLAMGIVLTGGAAQLKDVDTLFKKTTGLDVRIASPDIHVDEQSFEVAKDTKLSTAIGIVLCAAQSDKVSMVETVSKIVHEQEHAPAQKSYVPIVDEVEAKREPKHKKKKQPKKGWFDGWKDKVTGLFDSDIIDDNEI